MMVWCNEIQWNYVEKKYLILRVLKIISWDALFLKFNPLLLQLQNRLEQINFFWYLYVCFFYLKGSGASFFITLSVMKQLSNINKKGVCVCVLVCLFSMLYRNKWKINWKSTSAESVCYSLYISIKSYEMVREIHMELWI